MARTVIALYENFEDANRAVRDLVDRGFDRDQISLMASDASGEYSRFTGRDMPMEGESATAEGAGVGAGIGAVVGGLGGLLVGLGALTIPGIGPVIAAGPLAAALSGLAGAGAGAVAGGVTGGIIGGLTDLGVPEENAQYYAEGIRRGGTLVSVRVSDERTNDAVDILNMHSPVDINQRVNTWRSEGWSRFDPDAEPYYRQSASTETTRHEMGGTPTGDIHRDMEHGAATEYERRDMGASTEYERRDMGTSPEYERHDMGASAGMGETMSEPLTSRPSHTDFTDYETRFRNHFDTSYSAGGYSYEQYLPAYRYGYDLAVNDRFQDIDDWSALEPEARRYWDERNPGTWDRFKMAVEHAWHEVKQAVS